jgi:hypothetical protein
VSKLGKVVLPGQDVRVDTMLGVDPLWIEKLQQMAAFVSLFSEIDPATMATGQVLIWDATTKKFTAGAN